jgi:surfactin synthase thioesterase subunit
MSAPVTENDLWFRRYQPAERATVRLVCLPHAGGSASFWVPLARALSPAIDVLSVQYPGRQDRRQEPCIADIGALADEIAAALRPWCDRPLAILGHSMGATLGFELARRLEAEGQADLVRLFASGRRAPSVHKVETVHQKDDEGVLAELKKLSGTDARILGDEEIMRMALPAIRADYQAAETYRYTGGARLRCPVTALSGTADPKAPLDEVRPWAGHTDGEFELHTYAGGHFFLADHQPAIITLIREHLT